MSMFNLTRFWKIGIKKATDKQIQRKNAIFGLKNGPYDDYFGYYLCKSTTSYLVSLSYLIKELALYLMQIKT